MTLRSLQYPPEAIARINKAIASGISQQDAITAERIKLEQQWTTRTVPEPDEQRPAAARGEAA